MNTIHSSTPVSSSPLDCHASDGLTTHVHQGRMGDERVEVSTSQQALPHVVGTPPFRLGQAPHTAIDVAPALQGEIEALTSAQSTPATPATGFKERLLFLFKKTDLAAAVGQFNNREYLANERQPAHLPEFKQSVQALHDACRHLDMPAHVRKKLSTATNELMHKIDRIAKDKSMGYRTAATMMFSLANVGLAMLPTLTAHKNKDNQYFALLVAGYTKTLCMLTGIALSRTSDHRSHGLHIQERHVPYLPPNLPYAISAFNEKAKAFEEHNPILFHSMAAGFTAAVFVMSSAPHLVTKPLSDISEKIKGFFHKPTSQPQELARLSEDLSADIDTLLAAVNIQHGAFQQRRGRFEESGKELSDSLNVQLSEIDSATEQLANAAHGILGRNEESDPQQVANGDFAQKMAFVAIAGVLCLSSAATYYDEPAGLVDLGMDAGLTVFELAKTAKKPNENAQQAASKFSSYSGLSPLLLPFGILNKIPATHFTDNMPGLIAGTVFLTACNLTLPRPGGEAIANAVVKLMQSLKSSPDQRPDLEQGVVDSGRFTEIIDDPVATATTQASPARSDVSDEAEAFFEAQERVDGTDSDEDWHSAVGDLTDRGDDFDADATNSVQERNDRLGSSHSRGDRQV